jgi:hypothetical protein
MFIFPYALIFFIFMPKLFRDLKNKYPDKTAGEIFLIMKKATEAEGK